MNKIDNNGTMSAKYIIYKDGITIKAKNGTTGEVDYSGIDHAAVINGAINNLTAGRYNKERVILIGYFVIRDTIVLHSYTELDLVQARLLLGNNTNKDMIKIADQATNWSIIGGRLVGNSASQSSESNGINVTTKTSVGDSFSYIRDTYISSFYSDGVKMSGDIRATHLHNVTSTNNKGNGFNIAHDSTDNNFVSCVGSMNYKHGFSIAGSDQLVDTCYAFGNGQDHTTNYYGFYVSTNECQFSNCRIDQNDDTGFVIYNSKTISITGCTCQLNCHDTAGAGLKIVNSYNISIVGGKYFDDRGVGATQDYGIHLAGTTHDVSIVGVDFIANKTGAILNDSGGTNIIIKNCPGYKTENNILSGTFAIDSTSIKIVMMPHGLAITPAVQDCYLTVVQNTAVDDWAYNMLKIVSTDTKNVIVKINISTASTTVGATAKLALRVGNP